MKKFSSYILGILLVLVTSLPAYAAADTSAPSDVEDLSATPYNGAVHLEWSEATDNVGVKGYKVFWGLSSVSKAGQDYDENADAGKVLEYTVDGLANGTKYYFSVVAYDAAGLESEAWAPEAVATPDASADGYSDDTSPQVASAKALNEEEVKVVFTEAVVLPSADPENEFYVEDTDTFEPLDVLDAEMDGSDDSEKTVILTTSKQEAGAQYQLTVGINVEDKSGNSIVSGTSDTAIFDGSDESADTEDLAVEEVEVVDLTHVLVSFNKTVILGIDPAENFVINVEGDEADVLTVYGVELGENSDDIEDGSALLTVDEMSDLTYELVVAGVTDEDGNEIAEEDSKISFDGPSGDEPADTTPPKDVLNFLVKQIVAEAQKYNVKLGWTNPAENDGDTETQTLYVSADDDESFEEEDSVDGGEDNAEVKGLEPGDYWFKLTQTDAAGNESVGAITKVTLAETGPEMLGLLLVSLGIGHFAGKKRK